MFPVLFFLHRICTNGVVKSLGMAFESSEIVTNTSKRLKAMSVMGRVEDKAKGGNTD